MVEYKPEAATHLQRVVIARATVTRGTQDDRECEYSKLLIQNSNHGTRGQRIGIRSLGGRDNGWVRVKTVGLGETGPCPRKMQDPHFTPTPGQAQRAEQPSTHRRVWFQKKKYAKRLDNPLQKHGVAHSCDSDVTFVGRVTTSEI